MKIEILDPEMLVPPPPPSPQLEIGLEIFDLPPSPPPLPLISESLAHVTHDVPLVETGPKLKKSRNIKHMPDQREIGMDPLVSGTADIDLHGEDQREIVTQDISSGGSILI